MYGVIKTIAWKRVSDYLGVNIETGELVFLSAFENYLNNRVVYSNSQRCFACPHFYLRCHEETLGPFLTYEDALAEMQYRLDPLSLDYIPLREWEIIQ